MDRNGSFRIRVAFPRLKLKQNWISGCYALGSSYIALPWLAGQCTFGEVTPEIIVLTLWYSVAAVGIAIVNDFKSVEGAQHMLKPLQIQSTQFKTYQKGVGNRFYFHYLLLAIGYISFALLFYIIYL